MIIHFLLIMNSYYTHSLMENFLFLFKNMHKPDHIRHIYPILLHKILQHFSRNATTTNTSVSSQNGHILQDTRIYRGIWHTKILHVNFINKTEMEDKVLGYKYFITNFQQEWMQEFPQLKSGCGHSLNSNFIKNYIKACSCSYVQ